MKFTLLAYGSRGDVQPYVALALGLQAAGYEVQLAAPYLFADFVRGYGLDFTPLPGDPAQLVQALVDRAGRNPLRTGQVIAEFTLPLALQLLAEVRAACRGTDVVVSSFLTTLVGHEVARELDVPHVSALLFPVFTSTSAFPNPVLPELPLGRWYNWFTHAFFTQSFWQSSRLAYDWLLRRKNPGLPPLSGWPFSPTVQPPIPILYGISPQVLPRPADWGKSIHLTGYWFLEAGSSWQPPAPLVEFLAAGPPPVYLGFGSTITRDAERLVRVSLEALKQIGQRAILLSGWSQLERFNLPDFVFPIEAVPHDWLFPQMAAIVHHGGAGTTAAGLRAGVPAVIVPFTSDQPFWGRRVYQLGVGPQPIPVRQFTADKLSQALIRATSDEAMQQRAATLGERIRAENGVACAVEIMARLLQSRYAQV